MTKRMNVEYIDFLLIVLFVASTMIAWFLLNYSIKGFSHYESKFKVEAENNLEKMFLFFDYKRMFFINAAGLL